MRRLLPGLLFLALALTGRAAPSTAELAATPALWPTEVTVTRATRAEVIKAGRPAGAMLLGNGRVMSVLNVTADRVTGRIGGSEVAVPIEHTDLLARVGSSAVAAPAPSTPAPAPVAAAAATAKAAPPPVEPARPIPDVPPTPFQTALSGKLVAWQNGAVRTYDTRRLNGVKFFALYFSASWCGPCREFTPELVSDYAALKRMYPEFELVLVPWDKSEPEMHAYLRDDAMPWPAVRFADRRLRDVAKHAGRGIPCLVLVDAEGKELSHSYRWGNYVGPAQVVEDTWKILKEHRRALAGK